MNKIVAILFSIACLATSWTSGSLLGIGMWFWIIICSGVFVAISQFFSITRGIGAIVSALMGVISVTAVLLGLLAATVGGSFKLEGKESFLLVSFFLIAVFGFTLVKIVRKINRAEAR